MNMKKIIITLVLVLSLFSVSAYAKTMQFTMGDYEAKVDDGEITAYQMEVAPYTVEGRTMVPVRILTEAFDADVQYIHEESKVVVTLGDKVITLIIGEATADVNGETIALDVPTVVTNGRTLVPLRFVSENLGFDVEYFGSKEQILITDDPAVIEFNGAKISLQKFKAFYALNLLDEPEATEAELLDYTKYVLSQYVLYEAEADKLGISLDPAFYEEIRSYADSFNEVFSASGNVLDASWTGLLELDYRTSFLEDFLMLLYTPDEEVAEKYYNENYYNAKHILITDKATANKVLNLVKKGNDFDKLMTEYSEDGGLEGNPDGYLFATGEMVEEFENAVKGLQINKTSGLVESEFGYHIIKRLPLPEYSDEIKEAVHSSYTYEKVAKHFDDIADTTEMKTSAYTDEELLALCK